MMRSFDNPSPVGRDESTDCGHDADAVRAGDSEDVAMIFQMRDTLILWKTTRNDCVNDDSNRKQAMENDTG